MKIIDLLNKIANGEEVPKKIKYRNKIFIYDKDNQCYVVENYNEYYDLNMSLSNHKGTDLNYQVEILEEEKKIPEKLEDISEIKCVGCKVEINIIGNKTLFDTDTPIVTEHCIFKINQLIKNQKKIIDYLNSKENMNEDNIN